MAAGDDPSSEESSRQNPSQAGDTVIRLRAFVCVAIALAVTVVRPASGAYAAAESVSAVPTPPRPVHARMPFTLTVDAQGRFASPFRTLSSHVVKLGGPVVHGIPANNIQAPVAVLSCDAAYEGTTEATYFETIRVTVMNETPYYLRYTRIAFEVDRDGSYEDGILFGLKPYEMRSVIWTDGGIGAPGSPRHHPHWMLCGAGPAVLANGEVLQFNPSFLNPISP